MFWLSVLSVYFLSVVSGKKNTWRRTAYPTTCSETKLLLIAEAAEGIHAESAERYLIRIAIYARYFALNVYFPLCTSNFV